MRPSTLTTTAGRSARAVERVADTGLGHVIVRTADGQRTPIRPFERPY
jgi:hypothetical protein